MAVVPDDLRIPIPYPPGASAALRAAIAGYNAERAEGADGWDAALADAANALADRDTIDERLTQCQTVAMRRRARLLAWNIEVAAVFDIVICRAEW